MRAKKRFLAILVVIFAAVAAGAEGTPANLLRDGMYAELTEGDLDKAIGLYEQALEKAGEVERVAARAAYQIGLCYLKKGQKDKAAEYFDLVLMDYSKQGQVANKARTELAKIRPAKDVNIEAELLTYLGEYHQKAAIKAGELGTRLNTIVYYVDESFVLVQGGFLTVTNDTGQVIDDEITVGHFGNRTIVDCFDIEFAPQQIRFVEQPDREMGKWALKWTPSEPLEPGETKVLIYRNADEALPRSGDKSRLEMQNHFGSEVLESFILVVPSTMRVVQGLEGLTSHQRMKGFDVYGWQEQVPADTTHRKVVQLEMEQEYAEAAKPGVVETYPVTYSTDVDPQLGEISVTFDQDMHKFGWSWCKVAGNEYYPDVVEVQGSDMGGARYVDERTCVLPVKLEPGRAYIVVINAPPYQGFKSEDFIPAREYAIVFATKDAYGNETEIPTFLLEKAEGINKRSEMPDPVMDLLEVDVMDYLVDHYYGTLEKAQEMGLRTNSHVHIIDNELNRTFGMMQFYTNTTGKVIDHEVPMGNNDSPNMYIYDEKGVRQKIRTYKKPGSNYRYFWAPSEPIEPGETRMLFYTAGTSRLAQDDKGVCTLWMQNHYGSPVIETFYVVMPVEMEVVQQSEEFTDSAVFGDTRVVVWSKVQKERNVKHQVEAKIGKRIISSAADAKPVVREAVMTISGLPDGNPKISEQLEKLKAIERELALGLIGEYLSSASPTMRRSAIYILWKGEFGELGAVSDKLIELCSHEEVFTRGMAALVLGEKQVPGSFEILADMTLYDDSAYARRCGAYALGQLGDLDALDVLEQALEDEDVNVRNNADGAINTLKLQQEESVPLTREDKLRAENLAAEGWKLWGERKMAEAEEKFAEAIGLNPQAENAYQGLGWAQFNQGKTENAKAAFQKCVELNPDNSAALNGLGWIAHGAGDTDGAIAWWEKAVKASKGTATASLSGLTQVYMELGNYKQAVRYYKLWLRAEPNSQMAKEGLEKAQELMKR